MDELNHIKIFKNIINELKIENPNMINQEIINEVVCKIVDLEISWAKTVYGKGILGITNKTIEDIVYHRVFNLLKDIGFESPYEYRENPYKHLDLIGTDNGDTVKTGFFEQRLTNYELSSTMDGWDDI